MLPSEKLEIVKIIKEKINQKVFDIEELEISKESKYYFHIDFKEMMS
jgi:hypothetical protein